MSNLNEMNKAGTPSESIRYTQTKTFRFNQEELIKRKLFGGLVHHEVSDTYRQLRGQVLQKMRLNAWQSLAITSPSAGNGKTLTAINLAISLSQEVNQTVLLVDANFKSPGLIKAFGLSQIELGLTDYLFNQVELNKILINPEYKRLVMLPGTQTVEYSAELLSSPKMKQLQQELRDRYPNRIIIYDLPPLLVSDDAFLFLPQVDATLLVIEDGGHSKAELMRCQKLLNNTPMIGTIINKINR